MWWDDSFVTVLRRLAIVALIAAVVVIFAAGVATGWVFS